MTAHAEHLLHHLHRLMPRSSADLPSDATLLERFVRRGDQNAFAALVDRHGPMVHGVCRRVLHDAHAAEDATQAVFLVLARKADTIGRPNALASWLHRTAHRLALLGLRTESRRRQREGRYFAAALTPLQPDPLEELTVRELLRIVDEELRRLPEVYRLPVILCCLEGRTQGEAARQLGWTPGSVKGRLERGRMRLQRRLLRRGLAPAALLALEASRGVLSATLPARLHPAALRTAVLDGPIEEGVKALAEAGVWSMAVAKAKIVGTLLMAACTLAAGIGTLAHPELVARQPETASAAQTKNEAKGTRASKEKPSVSTDRYGDPLPPGAIVRLGTIRLRRGYTVYRLPDRDAILSVSPEEENMAVCVWQMSTGKLVRRFTFPIPRVSAGLSSDGKTLAVSGVDSRTGTNRIFFWDVATGKKLGELAVDGAMYALAFAPDGKTLATAGAGKVLRLWDWKAGTELRRIQADKAGWWTLAFSPDGKILAAASLQQRTIQLWDTATGRPLHTLGDGLGLRSSVVFSPDGKTVATASGDDKMVRLWDVATGREVRQFSSELGIYSLAFSLDGKLLAAGCNPESGKLSTTSPIHLWDVNTGKEVRRLKGHVFTVSSLVFSADGKKLISGSSSSVVKIWDIATGEEGVPLAEHESWVSSVAFSPDGRFLATGSLDGTIRLWQPATGKLVRVLEGDAGPQVLHVAFSPDGRSLISDRPDASLRVWDVATGRQTRRLPVGEGIYSLPFADAPDGRTLAVWRPDGTVRLLDAATGKEKRRLTGGATDGAYLCFSPDSGKLASLSFSYRERGGVLQVWDAASGVEKRKWTVSQRGPIVFSPDGQTLIGGTGDNSLPAGTKERVFHRWNVATGEDRLFPVAQHARVESLSISPSGRMLAWGDVEGIVTLWDLPASQVRRRLQGHHSRIRSLTFSPDGKSLASGSADTTALVWDVTGRPAAARPGPLAAERLSALWDDLASLDAAQAFDAIGLLTAAPEQAVPMLKDKLHPAPAPVDRKQVTPLIADLDSDQFAVRQKATEELRKLGERAEPALREAFNGKVTLEARKRIEELLTVLQDVSTSPHRLRELRAVEVLEHIGTPEAREVLRELAKGAAEARLTREAKAARERLAKRHHPQP